jgi:hypothetical protein
MSLFSKGSIEACPPTVKRIARAWTRSTRAPSGVALDGEQDPAELVVVEAEHGGAEPELRARGGRGSRGPIVLGRIEHPAAADAVLLLEDEGRAPGGGEDLGRGEAGGARAHHRDVHGEALGGAGAGGGESGSRPRPAR